MGAAAMGLWHPQASKDRAWRLESASSHRRGACPRPCRRRHRAGRRCGLIRSDREGRGARLHLRAFLHRARHRLQVAGVRLAHPHYRRCLAGVAQGAFVHMESSVRRCHLQRCLRLPRGALQGHDGKAGRREHGRPQLVRRAHDHCIHPLAAVRNLLRGCGLRRCLDEGHCGGRSAVAPPSNDPRWVLLLFVQRGRLHHAQPNLAHHALDRQHYQARLHHPRDCPRLRQQAYAVGGDWLFDCRCWNLLLFHHEAQVLVKPCLPLSTS
mmetsp:Transcript_44933/g.103171  ORF Transcript_44933/g.103171 Transcript_44933/m.103171 type:complete len:267 (-) Transcript_44933:434-1234(-)